MLAHSQLLLCDLPSPPLPKRRRVSSVSGFTPMFTPPTPSLDESDSDVVFPPPTPPTTPPLTAPARVPRSARMTNCDAVLHAHETRLLTCTGDTPCECTVEMLQAARDHFWKLNGKKQNDWVLQKMHLARTAVDKEIVRFPLAHATFCATCFRLIMGINPKRWFKLRNQMKQGVVSYTPLYKKATPKSTEAQVHVIQWLDAYVAAVGQFMPHVEEVHLPPGRWRQVYDLFVSEMQLDLGTNEVVCSPNYFNSLRKKFFPTVKVPPQQRFTKCKQCTLLKAETARTRIPEELKAIKKRQHKHLGQLMKERRKYWSRRSKARTQPKQYMSMIIDGMDQSKTLLPRFVLESSPMQRSLRLKAHLIGVMVHGRGNYVYVSNDRIHCDPNLTIHCILRTLQQLPPPLPKTLYHQADNAFRENKNKYVCAFLGMLTEAGLFNKVCSVVGLAYFRY